LAQQYGVVAVCSVPMFLFAGAGKIMHGGLYRWRGNSFPFFVNQKLKEILIRYSRIILPASKDRLISKI
jgi:hypothetical protein